MWRPTCILCGPNPSRARCSASSGPGPHALRRTHPTTHESAADSRLSDPGFRVRKVPVDPFLESQGCIRFSFPKKYGYPIWRLETCWDYKGANLIKAPKGQCRTSGPAVGVIYKRAAQG